MSDIDQHDSGKSDAELIDAAASTTSAPNPSVSETTDAPPGARFGGYSGSSTSTVLEYGAPTGAYKGSLAPLAPIAEPGSVYDFNHRYRGTCLIINNVDFDTSLDLGSRSGSDEDAKNLKRVFGKLGFEVRDKRNQSVRQMLQNVTELAQMNHRDADCLVCCVLSHGDEGLIYGRDGTIKVDDLINPFKPNVLGESLAGKPKLFFIQACRGTKLDAGVEVASDAPSDEHDGRGLFRRIPCEADFLVSYSVVPGYYSWRNSVRGSWFVQALSSVLEEHGARLDILSMMTRVCRKVAYDFESNVDNQEMSRKKQVPCIVSTLTKDLYFAPKQK